MTHAKKADLLAAIGTRLMRVWLATLRFEIIDRSGLVRDLPNPPLLWAFWHNRLFVMPYMFEKFFPNRPGAALASASKDGEIIAAVMKRFGIRPIRGSSSRRGAQALVEMKSALDEGFVTAITPDGPRGPCYRVNPGLIKLAQLTGGVIVPIHVRISSCWRLKSWDGFMIPKPFARVEIVFEHAHRVQPTETEEAFESERAAFERVLRAPEDGPAGPA